MGQSRRNRQTDDEVVSENPRDLGLDARDVLAVLWIGLVFAMNLRLMIELLKSDLGPFIFGLR